jgi:hypothetical protein
MEVCYCSIEHRGSEAGDRVILITCGPLTVWSVHEFNINWEVRGSSGVNDSRHLPGMPRGRSRGVDASAGTQTVAGWVENAKVGERENMKPGDGVARS